MTASPGAASAGAVVVSGIARTATELRLRLAVTGEPDVTVLIAARDGRPAWVETARLAVRYEGRELSVTQQRALRRIASSLRGLSFAELVRRVAVPLEAPGCGPDGSPRAPGEDRSNEIITVDEWGNPDRWRTFIFRREFQRNSSSAIRFRDGHVVVVSHGEAECLYATPRIDGRTMSLYNYPWVRPLERVLREAREPRQAEPALPSHVCTDLREADVITGGTARLESVLAALAPRTSAADLVIVRSTCVPRVIGDDMEAAVARWRGRARIRYDDVLAPEPTDRVAEILAEAIAAPRRRRRRGPSISLAGLPPGAAFLELRELLAAAGIEVRCALVPEIDLAAAASWRDAARQVLVPNPYFRRLYERVFVPLAMETLTPPAPYGVAAAQRWLDAIARACGRTAALRRAWRTALARLGPALDAARSAAAGERLGFVASPDDYAALCDPEQTAGIPVLDVAVELGFGIDLLVYAADPAVPEPAIVAAHARAVTVHRFADRAELRALLRDAPCRAVYSDLYGDQRVRAAGKAPFSLQFFEPGLGGALRTAERLLGACRVPFFRKYPGHDHAT